MSLENFFSKKMLNFFKVKLQLFSNKKNTFSSLMPVRYPVNKKSTEIFHFNSNIRLVNMSKIVESYEVVDGKPN